MKPTKILTIIVLVTLATTAVGAVQHPNNERGFSPEKAYEVGDLDNVNLFNGALSLTIPIGAEYTVGGGFSYQLTLVYNANVWDWDFVCDSADHCQSQPRPGLDDNAGLGWGLHMGFLYEPMDLPRNPSNRWIYAAADGSEHRVLGHLAPRGDRGRRDALQPRRLVFAHEGRQWHDEDRRVSRRHDTHLQAPRRHLAVDQDGRPFRQRSRGGLRHGGQVDAFRLGRAHARDRADQQDG